MSLSPIQRLMNNVRARCPGAVDAALKQEMFAALDQFFKDSNVWQEEIDFAVTAGTQKYELTPEGVGAIHRLVEVKNGTGTPVLATMEVPGTLLLDTKPSQNGTYTAMVTLVVIDPTNSNDYPQFPDWILLRYQNELIDGVLSRMFSQAAKPYSNERLAVLHHRKFIDAIATARRESRRKNTFGRQRWRFPKFA